MTALYRAGLLLLAIGLFAHAAAAEAIVSARYADATTRYGHFALGKPHEYVRLIATTDNRRELHFELPPHEVFEDRAPRIVRLAPGEPALLLTIVSSTDGGARLVLMEVQGGALAIAAESAPVGTPMRWMNPVGVADLDGDGRAEIAAVVTPHIGGTLKVWRRSGKRLVEAAALGGFSNHVYGSSELGLSTPIAVGGRMMLAVPDTTRTRLRLIGFDGHRLVESRSCPLDEPLRSAIVAEPGAQIGFVTTTGRTRRSIALEACPE